MRNSLGIDKHPSSTRVVVAMSGGVDSSVVAALLKEEGYEVVGMTLQLYDQGATAAKKGACCAGQDIYDAKRVADHIGIPHYVLDYESRFRESVIDAFADSYVRGETPVPCILCNQTVKFHDLLKTAQELGADVLATGHYVSRREGPNGPELHRASDKSRDQSYFLFTTTREQLNVLRFPLGEWPKARTRTAAQRLGLPVAEKPDSQDICFVPQGRYSELVAKLRPEACQPGEIVHMDGRVLGQHQGILHYTVGQRRGLGVINGDGTPLYVVALEPETRRVLVGDEADLAVQTVPLSSVNWLGGEQDEGVGIDILVKLRSTTRPAPARLIFHASGHAHVELRPPQKGVSPGQACVFYDELGEHLLGGGWIMRANRRAA